MAQSKSLKVSLKGGDVSASYGEDIEFSADLSSVKDVITGAVGTLGVENCLKLGGGAVAATAMYVVVKSIAKHYPWAKATDVKQDVVELSVPAAKEDKFEKMMKNEALQNAVSNDFENLETSIDAILGEEEAEKYGEQVVQLLRNIRVGSIAEKNVHKESQSIVAAEVVLGEKEVDEVGSKKMVAVAKDGNGRVGIIAGTYFGENASVKGKSRGCHTFVVAGFSGEEASNILEKAQGDGVKIKIVGDILENTFEREFGSKTTVSEVIKELKKEGEVPKDAKVRIRRGEEILDPNWTLAHAESNGSTVNWFIELDC